MDDVYDFDCSNVLERGFERRVKRKTNRLLHRERTWHDRVFNKCFKKAVKKRLREIGNECLDDPDVADDCDELGEVAARLIVQGKNWEYAWVCNELYDTSYVYSPPKHPPRIRTL